MLLPVQQGTLLHADAAGQGKLFIEAQVKEGYDLSFSIAVTAVSSVLAVIIPPSILMVVWGGVISTSIGAMYLAGIVPGVLLCLAQMATVHAYSIKRNYPVYPRANILEIVKSAGVAIPAMLTPVIIVGGILLGLIESIGSGYIGHLTGGVLGSHYADIFAFIVLIVVLTLRPSGLMGERVADRA